MEWAENEAENHDAEPCRGCVTDQFVTVQDPGYLMQAPFLMAIVVIWLPANPTKLCVAAGTCHVVACSILCDWHLALDALCHKQVSCKGRIQDHFILTLTSMVWLPALKARLIATFRAQSLAFAAATWPADHRVAVCCRAPL